MSKRLFPSLNPSNLDTALIQGDKSYTYKELNDRIQQVGSGLLGEKADLNEERVALFVPASIDYVSTLLGVWAAGGIAVPLNVHATEPELEHCLVSSGASRVVTCSEFEDKLTALCARIGVELVDVAQLRETPPGTLPSFAEDRRAMMLFTSGTTNKPKGVVSTHENLQAQVSALIEAWVWSDQDCIPLFLPLHHIHGIINVLCCALSSGAKVHLYAKFEASTLLHEVRRGTFNVFMAVPTIYIKLIQYIELLEESEKTVICDAFNAMRLNVSGSAACPVNLFNQWKELTNQVLLERYGMTEIGMAISNPYRGDRRAGYVGQPLPGVDVALFDEQHQQINEESQPGEIRIRGKNVFLEYWRNPEATEKSFSDGWFCTGDIGVVENRYFRIMGRSSVDIIKSGGYKLSALEIEGVLLNHESITECAVVGIEDPTWGEVVTAFVVLKPGASLDLPSLKSWSESRLSPYKIPKKLHLLTELPRNAMGKVTKPSLRKLLV